MLKPFQAGQLEARIRAVLRRAAGAADAGRRTVTVGDLTVDPRSRRVTLAGQPVELSPKEFDLLAYLAARAGTVVTKRELLTEVWQLPYGGSDKTVDVHLSWLRRKLGESAAEPRLLQTVRGVGRPAGRARAVRRQITLLVAATTSVVLLAFLLPAASWSPGSPRRGPLDAGPGAAAVPHPLGRPRRPGAGGRRTWSAPRATLHRRRALDRRHLARRPARLADGDAAGRAAEVDGAATARRLVQPVRRADGTAVIEVFVPAEHAARRA